MFQSAETGARVDKEEFELRLPDLRVALVNAQYDLREADFPVIIVVDGDDWEAVKRVLIGFSDWMDPRFIQFHAMDNPDAEDGMRPTLWRFWNRLPARGQIAAFANAWTVGTIRDSIRGEIDRDGFERRLQQIRRFEQDQVNGGALILKFWLHLPKKELKKRVKEEEKSSGGGKKKDKKKDKSKDANLSLSAPAKTYYAFHDEIIEHSSRLIEVTDDARSPWHIVESTDRRHLSLTLGETILKALRTRLDAPAHGTVGPPPPEPPERANSILDSVDLDSKLERKEYKKDLAKYQDRLLELTTEAYEKKIASVLVFEGWDAAGKGGVIRRILHGTDIRRASVVPIAAPTDEELSHHYLWRFWRKLPRPGEMVMFDRSWYGRVLVERVEELTSVGEWRRGYSEINHFEEQLVEAGVIVHKFWLHIDADEQLARFEAREQTPYKKYKITTEDYRNREKWDDYVAAVDEMVARTSTTSAPWTLVPAKDKPYARVKVLKTICDAFKDRL